MLLISLVLRNSSDYVMTQLNVRPHLKGIYIKKLLVKAADTKTRKDQKIMKDLKSTL